MNNRKPVTDAEHEARKAFAATDAPAILSEHQLREKSFFENRERLKRERLQREAKKEER